MNKKLISIIVLTILILLVGTRIFYRLPSTSINDNDEAWHAVNAYEMYQNNTFLINTCRGEVDYYNTKPPLALWGTLICFHLFGINMLTLKITAAMAGFLTCIVTALFLYKKYGIEQSIYFSSAFLLMYKIFDYHGFRTANLDGVYIFFFTLAMLTLWKAIEKNVYLILFGFWVGCAFLTKCAHISSLILIAIFAIPMLKKNWKWKNFMGSILACAIPILLWMLARYQYDGTKFIMATMGEIVAKTSSSATTYFISITAKEPVFLAFLVIGIAYCIMTIFVKKDGVSIRKSFLRDLKEAYIAWLWFLVPMIVFSLAGNHADWYVYQSYIGLCVLIAIYGNKATQMIGNTKIRTVCIGIFVCVAILIAGRKIYYYKLNGMGGSYCERMQALCEELEQDYGDEYNSKKIYMATPFRTEGKEGVNTEWYTEFIALFDIYADMICLDGGVGSFLAEEDALLVLDKDLWDSYADILTGYFIVEDGDGYLLFYSKTYAEM